MATTLSHLPITGLAQAARLRDRRRSLLLATALTPLTLLIHGFHPFTEDGGIYLAGVQHALNPALFPHFTAFVLAPTSHSVFAVVIAALANLAHLTGPTGLPALVFALHLATLWTTLFAASVLASRCWPSPEARAGATLLLACWIGLPVAGTSLLFMDPYLTARSFSTPCLIAALIGALDATACPGLELPHTSRRSGLILAIASLIAAALFHPLMAGYAVLSTVLLAACRIPTRSMRLAALAGISAVSLLVAACIQALAPPDTPAYTQTALTRGYWFLSTWHWYELIGIAAPWAILAFYAYLNPEVPSGTTNSRPVAPERALAAAASGCTVLVTAIALLFAHRSGDRHLLAALQPMRGLQFVYLVLMLCLGANLGATLGARILRRNPLAWLLTIPLLALPLFAASRAATPHTRHIELPGLDSGNDWVRAFAWIRTHTPADALFALPANYISIPGEDAQCFRAVAQRSAVPDYSKDGGEAAVAPSLAGLWTVGEAAQATLAADSDTLRRTKLEPLGVTWLVLPATSATALDCPYTNASVRVCRLP